VSNDLTPSLSQLATQSNAEHAQAETTLRAGLEHARNAGRLLLPAKEQCQHGEWLPWLKDNVRFSERTARAYMTVARRWEELSKSATVADLSFRDGLKLLSDRPVEPAATVAGTLGYHRPFLEWTPECRHDTVTKWWDLQAEFTVLLTAQGWQPAAIAESMSIPVLEIERILIPEPPVRFDTAINGLDMFRPAEAHRSFVQHYHATVREITSNMLGMIYHQAVFGAEREGLPEEIGQEMSVLEKYHKTRGRGPGKETIWQMSFKNPNHRAIAWCCALSDARTGLGIDAVGDQPFRSLWKLFDDESKKKDPAA
jgi:hypothetical protein